MEPIFSPTPCSIPRGTLAPMAVAVLTECRGSADALKFAKQTIKHNAYARICSEAAF